MKLKFPIELSLLPRSFASCVTVETAESLQMMKNASSAFNDSSGLRVYVSGCMA